MRRLTGLLVALLLTFSPVARAEWSIPHKIRHSVRVNWKRETPRREVRAVMWCESRDNPWAKSPAGHWGLLQLGEYERAATDWGWAIHLQMAAARRWYDLTGSDWGSWSCQP